MIKNFKICLIGLDKQANRAIDLASPNFFHKVIKSDDIQNFINANLSSYKTVLVASDLETLSLEIILEKISLKQKPIIIFPENMENSPYVETLIANDFRLIVSPNKSLISISLSDTIFKLETILYREKDDDIYPTHKDFYTKFSPRDIGIFQEIKSRNFFKASVEFWNILETQSDFLNLYLLFECNFRDNISLLDITTSVEMIEKRLSVSSNKSLLAIKNLNNFSGVRILGFLIKPFNIFSKIQQELDKSGSYFQKISIILDKFNKRLIDGEVADYIAEINKISPEDLKLFYKKIYSYNKQLLELLGVLKYSDIDMDIKVDVIVNVIDKDLIDIDIISELTDIFNIPISSIALKLNLISEGKISLKEITTINSEVLGENQEIIVARNGVIPVLVLRDEVWKENIENRTFLVIEQSSLLKKDVNGWDWLISQNINDNLVDLIINKIDVEKDIFNNSI